MDFRPLVPVGLLLAGVAALVVTLAWMRRRGWIDTSRDRVRRGVGHAMLGVQEFVEPSVEYIFQAENAEQADEDDPGPAEGGPEALLADLATGLGRDPVDPEEIRRHLASARRAELGSSASSSIGRSRMSFAGRPYPGAIDPAGLEGRAAGMNSRTRNLSDAGGPSRAPPPSVAVGMRPRGGSSGPRATRSGAPLPERLEGRRSRAANVIRLAAARAQSKDGS